MAGVRTTAHTMLLIGRVAREDAASTARLEAAGMVLLSFTLDHAGPLTHTVEDCALAMQVLAGCDAMLCAGNPTAAPRVVDVDEGPFRKSHPITGPFNATGHPGLVLPCGFGAAGLPLGPPLIGRNYGEAMLFRIAQAYEQAAGWMAQRPALRG